MWGKRAVHRVQVQNEPITLGELQGSYNKIYQLRREYGFGAREGGRPGGHKRALRWGVEESEEGGRSG